LAVGHSAAVAAAVTDAGGVGAGDAVVVGDAGFEAGDGAGVGGWVGVWGAAEGDDAVGAELALSEGLGVVGCAGEVDEPLL